MSKEKIGFSTGKGFFQNKNEEQVDTANKATEAEYASSDHTKGTIEERLTNLGFKSLSTSEYKDIMVSGAYSGKIGTISIYSNAANREGNRANIKIDVALNPYVLGSNKSSPFYEFYFNSAEATVTGLIPEEYRPKVSYFFFIYGKTYLEFKPNSDITYVKITDNVPIKCTISPLGNMTLQISNPLSVVCSNISADDNYTYREITGYSYQYEIGYSVNPLNS